MSEDERDNFGDVLTGNVRIGERLYKSCDVRNGMGRSGEIRNGMDRSGEIRNGVDRSGEIRNSVDRSPFDKSRGVSDGIQIRFLSAADMKKLTTALRVLDCPQSFGGDYRDLGEVLLGMTVHDIRLLDASTSGQKGKAEQIVEQWTMQCPESCLDNLQNALYLIRRLDVESDVRKIAMKAHVNHASVADSTLRGFVPGRSSGADKEVISPINWTRSGERDTDTVQSSANQYSSRDKSKSMYEHVNHIRPGPRPPGQARCHHLVGMSQTSRAIQSVHQPTEALETSESLKSPPTDMLYSPGHTSRYLRSLTTQDVLSEDVTFAHNELSFSQSEFYTQSPGTLPDTEKAPPSPTGRRLEGDKGPQSSTRILGSVVDSIKPSRGMEGSSIMDGGVGINMDVPVLYPPTPSLRELPSHSEDQKITIPDPELRSIIKDLMWGYSNRLDVRLLFYCRLGILALLGLIDTVHRIFRSAFYDPIDYSTWSLFFYVISLGKELWLYALTTTIPVVLHAEYHMYSLAHLYLIILVLLQITQDKAVSFTAKEMRQYYINMVCLNGLGLETLRAQCRINTETRQRYIQRHLQLFVFLQSLVLLVLYINTDLWCWPHRVIGVWCGVAYFGKVCVYVCHYRVTAAQILHGRFKIDRHINKRHSVGDGPSDPQRLKLYV